jgi:hypothetical protein
MIPRDIPLRVPESPRYWSVSHARLGEHHFRLPIFSTMQSLAELLTRRLDLKKGTDGKIPVSEIAKKAHIMCVLLGACWYHRAAALLAVPPGPDATDDQWVAFGVAVLDELQEYGYDLLDITEIFNGVMPRVSDALDFSKTIKERKDFFGQTPASSTSSP